MNNRYYVLEVTINSNGTETRNFTPYDVHETALRKFYEVFTKIGGGSLKISALLLDSNLYIVKSDTWEKEVEPEPQEETPTEE